VPSPSPHRSPERAAAPEAIALREVVAHGARVVDSLPWDCPPTRVAAAAGTASGL